jgi:predicted house-cleaning noncanonical NTP pyrophosphatase (MazG superfamily)
MMQGEIFHKSGDKNCYVSAYKTLLYDLIGRNEELIKSLILKYSQSRNKVAEYLKRTLNKTGKVVHIYCNVNKEFKELLTQKMKEHWSELFEDKKSRYNEIAMKHTQRLQHSKEY